MKIGRPPLIPKPFMLPDSWLFSSDVGESEYSGLSTTGSYAISSRVQVVSPSSTVTISNAMPCVVTWANHGLPGNTPITIATSGALPGGLTVGGVYFVKDPLQGTFNLSEYPGGPAIATSSAGSGTHTATATRHDILQALLPTAVVTASIATTTLDVTAVTTGALAVGHVLSGTGVTAGTYIVNQLTGTAGGIGTYTVSASQTVASTAITGNALASNETYWQRITSTNKWRMFDASTSSQSSRSGSMTVEIRPKGRFNALYLGNISAATIQIQIRDSVGTLHYDQTISGVSDSWELSHYGWWFDPIERLSATFLADLPNLLDPRITITLTDTGKTVQCGVCAPCLTRDIGATQYGMRSGIKDYSIKSVDDFGNTRLIERSFARTVSALLMVSNDDIDAVVDILSSYRSSAIVYSASDTYTSSIVFGWFSDFHNELQYPSESLLSIEIESLT